MNNLICVLENCEDLTEMLTLLLEEHYQVVRARTIAELNNMVRELKPALFLLDLIFPDGDGLDVPVLIMSANFQLEKMKEWAYADDCIAKPFDIDDLQNRIAKLIEPKDN